MGCAGVTDGFAGSLAGVTGSDFRFDVNIGILLSPLTFHACKADLVPRGNSAAPTPIIT
jgi:hypothetical protein